ncbi:hypothetical protein FRC03_007506 [Tulasnella sp. 419]|nr:hypothetical protein FRC03_007506 [Tulasnella sp. 419]
MLPPPTLKDDPDVAHDIAQRAYLELSSLPPTFADPSFLENYVPLKSRPIKDQIDQLSTRKADVRSTEMEQRDSAIISKLGAEFRHHAQQESGLVEDICIPGEVERKRDSKAELEARKEASRQSQIYYPY